MLAGCYNQDGTHLQSNGQNCRLTSSGYWSKLIGCPTIEFTSLTLQSEVLISVGMCSQLTKDVSSLYIDVSSFKVSRKKICLSESLSSLLWQS